MHSNRICIAINANRFRASHIRVRRLLDQKHGDRLRMHPAAISARAPVHR
jgi:hypothetical protein